MHLLLTLRLPPMRCLPLTLHPPPMLCRPLMLRLPPMLPLALRRPRELPLEPGQPFAGLEIKRLGLKASW